MDGADCQPEVDEDEDDDDGLDEPELPQFLSSLLSLQSSCPSHSQILGIQIPLSHLKSPRVHSK